MIIGRRNIYLAAFFMVCSAYSFSDTVHNKTITGVFVNQGSLIAFRYEPVDPVSNPNNCDTSYVQLNHNGDFFREQYSLLLMLAATGKKVDIHIGTACGYNIIADWFYAHE
jgi:hypothetical protein